MNEESKMFRGSPPVSQKLKSLRMILALVFDRRVSIRYKALPIGALLWGILPDFISGMLDDFVIASLAPQTFLDLCRQRYPEVYRFHYDRIFPEEAAEEAARELREREEKV